MEKQIKKLIDEISTNQKPTWCPGCTNYSLLYAFKKAIAELIYENKIKKEQLVYASGIGCHGKIHDYLKLSSFYGIHGRVLPILFGIKTAKPQLKVIGFAGDGDAYDEGMSHLIHLPRYNLDCTYIVHNNQIFALTTGQPTATTQLGLRSKSYKNTVKDIPLNPIKLMLSLNTSFVARGYALEIEHLKEIFKQAMMHRGFSFVEVLQPCIVFNDTREFINKRVYKLEETNHNPSNFEEAWKRASEWNYCYDENARVAIGIFYKTEIPTFEERYRLT